MKTAHSIKKYTYVQNDHSLAAPKAGFTSFSDGGSPGSMRAQGSALGVPSALRHLKGNHGYAATCREALEPECRQSSQQELERARAAEAAAPFPPNCSAPPLTPSGIETFVSVSVLMRALISNVIYRQINTAAV